MDEPSTRKIRQDRWIASVSVLIASVACLATVILGLSTPQQSYPLRNPVSSSQIYIADLWFGNFTDSLRVSSNVASTPVAWTSAPFVPQFQRRVPGNCLPSGLRSDFCVTFGQLDSFASLFSVIPACRLNNITQDLFLGACRVSDTEVIDYCITTADVDWSLCRQVDTDCVTTTLLNTATLVVNELDTDTSIVSFPLTLLSSGAVSTLYLNVGVFSYVENGPILSTVSYVHTINGGVSLVSAPVTNQPIIYNGETVISLSAVVDTSSIPEDEYYHANMTTVVINSVEIFFGGFAHDSRIRILSASVSSCFNPLIPACTDQPLRVLHPDPVRHIESIVDVDYFFVVTTEIRISAAYFNTTTGANWATVSDTSTLMITVYSPGCIDPSIPTVEIRNATSSECITGIDFSIPQTLLFPAPVLLTAEYNYTLFSIISGVQCPYQVTVREITNSQCDHSEFVPADAFYPCSL